MISHSRLSRHLGGLDTDSAAAGGQVGRVHDRHGLEAVMGAVRGLAALVVGLERAYPWRGRARYDQGQTAQAIADLGSAIKLNPKYAEAYTARGNAFVARGDLVAAIADYNKAVELNPRLAVAWLNKGKAHSQRGERIKAENALREFVAIAPEVGLGYRIPEAEKELGELDWGD